MGPHDGTVAGGEFGQSHEKRIVERGGAGPKPLGIRKGSEVGHYINQPFVLHVKAPVKVVVQKTVSSLNCSAIPCFDFAISGEAARGKPPLVLEPPVSVPSIRGQDGWAVALWRPAVVIGRPLLQLVLPSALRPALNIFARVALACLPAAVMAEPVIPPDSPFRVGEGFGTPATCETLPDWVDRVPAYDGRLSMVVEGTVTEAHWDGVLAYLVICAPEEIQVMCVTYEPTPVGTPVQFAGGYARVGERQVMLDPCLTFAPGTKSDLKE